ncbi:hypothetical protein ANANG_G00223670 [Anguilla anguilla]|uniref:YTH domain-containing family protein n=1 Tax=Anguilla anguilla TaxID=7936 RepID=A0A9D3LYY1_ANGAN|nr:hypothetical protein ANANG_G00223670 [Anguilla anguilla]
MPLPGGALPPPPIKHNMDIGTWDNKGPVTKVPQSHPQLPHSLTQQPPAGPAVAAPAGGLAAPHTSSCLHSPIRITPGPSPQTRWVAPATETRVTAWAAGTAAPPLVVAALGAPGSGGPGPAVDSHPVLEKLRAAHSYNPKDFDWNVKNGRVFIIKSYSEDDIHRSIKYSIWCSTEHGNKRLDGAFRAMNAKGPVYLLFSVNGSGHFCGVAEMRSPVDYGTSAGVWSQDKWKGKFDVNWLFVKDVPNSQLRHIRLENNDNKPVTNSRDTQEVPLEKAKQVLKIIATYKHTTSIFDDFSHYEKRQEEEEVVRKVTPLTCPHPPRHHEPSVLSELCSNK